MAILNRFIRAYRDVRVRNRLRRVETQLAGMAEPSFTGDHVGFKAEIWDKHLSSLAGKDGLMMLEIGSHEGRSAIWFAEKILTGSGCLLTCVDPWPAMARLRFDHNIRVAGVDDRIRAIHKPSERALIEDLAGETFDVIYIDGGHRAPNVLFDAVFAWPLLASGGIMVFDDYEWKPELPQADRPKPAIDRFMALFQDQIEVVEMGFQVLLRKK